MHALAFNVREARPIRLLIELDDVFCLRVEIRRQVPDASGEHRIGGQAIGLVARRHAGFAAGADGVVVEHGDGIGCGHRVFGVLAARSVYGQARDRSAQSENSHEGLTPADLTWSGCRAHSDAFELSSGPGSGVVALPGGLEPGTFSSFFTLENLREAT